MKEIRAYIEKNRLNNVIIALLDIPEFPGISVSDCVGFGRESVDNKHDFGPRFARKRLEIFAPDAMVEAIVSILSEQANIGSSGDGKLFILPVYEGLRFSTGERGSELG